MDINDYSWNEHEREMKLAKAPLAQPKIKILDEPELREKLALLLEELPHAILAEWALNNAEPFLEYLEPSLLGDQRITIAKNMLTKRLAGEASAAELRRAGFIANELAKESTSDVSRYAARVFAQAIATGHMRGHAMVSADYAIKVTNLLCPNDLKKVTELRKRQIACAREMR